MEIHDEKNYTRRFIWEESHITSVFIRGHFRHCGAKHPSWDLWENRRKKGNLPPIMAIFGWVSLDLEAFKEEKGEWEIN